MRLEEVADNVTVPIIKALPLIRSLVQNSHITTNNGLHNEFLKDLGLKLYYPSMDLKVLATNIYMYTMEISKKIISNDEKLDILPKKSPNKYEKNCNCYLG